MATKFVVQAVERSGYGGSWRAGRFWPSSAPTEIEVVEGTKDGEDPPEDLGKGLQVGTKAFEALKNDRTLRVVPAGDPMAMAKAAKDVPTLRAEVERLTAENQRLKDQAASSGGHAGGRPKRSEQG